MIATAASIVSIDCSTTSIDEECVRISHVMLFGLPLLVGPVYGSELHPRFKAPLHPFALIAMTGVFFLLPAGVNSGAVCYRFWMMVLMAFALASVAPSLVREGELNWWRVNVGWLDALALAAIMTGIVERGLQLSLLSVEKLFGMEVRFGSLMNHLHGDLFALAGCLIGPVAPLALFPPAKEEFNADQPGFKVWANLCKWALIKKGVYYSISGF